MIMIDKVIEKAKNLIGMKDKEEVQRETLEITIVDKVMKHYKEAEDGNRVFHQKCTENEEYWKAQWWKLKNINNNDPKPTSTHLFSSVENLHADMMDNEPEPIILPSEPNDEDVVHELNDIVPLILEKRDFHKTYDKNCREKLKKIGAVYKTFWDNNIGNGFGDINIIEKDPTTIYPDPYVDDIQDGRYFIEISWHTKEWFLNHPKFKDKAGLLSSDGYRRENQYTDKSAKNIRDDEIMLIHYYYKKDGRVHKHQVASNVFLYSSEYDENFNDTGLYESGLYPFDIDIYLPLEGTPWGMSMIDIHKNEQEYIDKLDQIIIKNAYLSGKTRYIVSKKAGFTISDFTDYSKDVITSISDNVGDDTVRIIQTKPLDSFIMQHRQKKIDEFKMNSGQNEFSRGEAGKGVTAASAIMALQEAGNKRSRDTISYSYGIYKSIITKAIWLIKQHYTEGRMFRVTDKDGNYNFKRFDNRMLIEKVDIDFDIIVKAGKANPVDRAYRNELAKEFYNMGLFGDPQDITTKIATMELVDFDDKEKIMELLRSKKQEIDNQNIILQLVKELQTGENIEDTVNKLLSIPIEVNQ